MVKYKPLDYVLNWNFFDSEVKSIVLLYRYRPIETGLKELRNFSIYFSSVSKLNDPVGGGAFNVCILAR